MDDGSGEPRTIVCGAPNVAAGQTVAVALPGATMPDGTKLGEAKLRGVRSSGMILAEDEVGIGTDHAGIMVLPDDLAPGEALAGHLPIADEVLELEVTPNRPDVMSVYGVARDLHAVTGAPLAADPDRRGRRAEPEATPPTDHASVEIDPEICLRFSRARVRGREGGALAALAQATADGRRPAPDLERGGHHQLRDARPPASRCTRSTSTACAAGGSWSGAPPTARR